MKKNLSFWATICIISVLALFIVACGGQADRTTNIRPAETNGPVFQAGHTEHTTEIVRKDIEVKTCDGTKESRWTWAPGEMKSFTTLGREVSVREQFGLKPGESLAVVDSVTLPKSKVSPEVHHGVPMNPAPTLQPVKLTDNDETDSSESSNLKRVWILLFAVLGVVIFFIGVADGAADPPVNNYGPRPQ